MPCYLKARRPSPRHIVMKLSKVSDKEIILKQLRKLQFPPLSAKGESFRWKIKKETLELNQTFDKIDLTDIYRNFIQQQQNLYSSGMNTGYFLG